MAGHVLHATAGPHLVALSGALEGSVFRVQDGETSFGRDSTCTVCIPNRRVSRRHAVLTATGDGYEIADLDSLNGVFVNDVPVSRCELASGDRIRIDDTTLLFFLPGRRHDVPVSMVQWSDDEPYSGEGALDTASAALVWDETLGPPTPEQASLESTESLLLVVSELLGIHDVAMVARRALEILLKTIGAESGAVVFGDGSIDEPATAVTFDRTLGVGAPLIVSRPVALQVVTTGKSYMRNDTARAGAGKKLKSLATPKSVLAVPAGANAIVYLESRNPAFKFTPEDAQYARTLGRLVAVSADNARRYESLNAEHKRLIEDFGLQHRMIGESPAMNEVYETLARVARSNASVLLLGESGTGKELAARAVHSNSDRAEGPFVAINCAALTESLLESELFGHEKGAFTGAYVRKTGKLELAHGGTVFLDEIAELTPALQAKLLRVLQEREFERVGGTRKIAADFRLIVATNQDLKRRVVDGRFRDDLYYRINVISVTMPALRDRREDIGLLASFFVAQAAENCKRRVAGISPDARSALVQYDWPGNVRELENAIERAVVLGRTPMVLLEDLPVTVRRGTMPALSEDGSYQDYVLDAKRRIILKAFDEAGGSYVEAARILRLNPTYLQRLIRRLNLRGLVASANR